MRGMGDMRGMGGRALGVLLLCAAAVPLAGQTLEQRVRAVADGEVRMSFAARAGVCGDGHNIYVNRRSRHWEPDCDSGPVRVVLTFRAGRLHDVDARVGGRWRAAPDVVDLGTVSAPEAAALLLGYARTVDGRAGKEAILPATLADSATVWPELIAIARDDAVRREVRKSAVFWLGQAAGAAAVGDLRGLVDNPDRDVQESAVFALSQLRDDVGVPALIEIARTHDDPKVRKTAMFWLGQSGDARAIELFEEILIRGN